MIQRIHQRRIQLIGGQSFKVAGSKKADGHNRQKTENLLKFDFLDCFRLLGHDKPSNYQRDRCHKLGVEIESCNIAVGDQLDKDLLRKIRHTVGNACNQQKNQRRKGKLCLDGIIIGAHNKYRHQQNTKADPLGQLYLFPKPQAAAHHRKQHAHSKKNIQHHIGAFSRRQQPGHQQRGCGYTGKERNEQHLRCGDQRAYIAGHKHKKQRRYRAEQQTDDIGKNCGRRARRIAACFLCAKASCRAGKHRAG